MNLHRIVRRALLHMGKHVVVKQTTIRARYQLAGFCHVRFAIINFKVEISLIGNNCYVDWKTSLEVIKNFANDKNKILVLNQNRLHCSNLHNLHQTINMLHETNGTWLELLLPNSRIVDEEKIPMLACVLCCPGRAVSRPFQKNSIFLDIQSRSWNKMYGNKMAQLNFKWLFYRFVMMMIRSMSIRLITIDCIINVIVGYPKYLRLLTVKSAIEVEGFRDFIAEFFLPSISNHLNNQKVGAESRHSYGCKVKDSRKWISQLPKHTIPNFHTLRPSITREWIRTIFFFQKMWEWLKSVANWELLCNSQFWYIV
jgi:hypothetical protein